MSTAVAGVVAGLALAKGSAARSLSSRLSDLECGKEFARSSETERWCGRAARTVWHWLADAELTPLDQMAARPF